MEHDCRWKTTSGGRRPSVEDDLRRKTPFSGRRHSVEDNFLWKTTYVERQPMEEDPFSERRGLLRFAAFLCFGNEASRNRYVGWSVSLLVSTQLSKNLKVGMRNITNVSAFPQKKFRGDALKSNMLHTNKILNKGLLDFIDCCSFNKTFPTKAYSCLQVCISLYFWLHFTQNVRLELTVSTQKSVCKICNTVRVNCQKS